MEQNRDLPWCHEQHDVKSFRRCLLCLARVRAGAPGSLWEPRPGDSLFDHDLAMLLNVDLQKFPDGTAWHGFIRQEVFRLLDDGVLTA